MIIENKHGYYKQSNYRNEDLIEVYKDTLLKATNYPHGTTNIFDSTTRIDVKLWAHYNKKDGEVFVENIDTVSAIMKYTTNFKVAVLNMASYLTPGGGVAYGAKAQEEALFRCSNLGLSISNEYYPLKWDEILYTRNVVFFKDKDYNDLNDGYLADVITCAAPKIVDGVLPIDYESHISTKIETMLNVAAINAVDTLILGAWGCGVYKNDPKYIAETFKKHLLENNRRFCFKRVVFAVINDQNSVGSNYEIFKSVIDGTFKD